MLEAHVFMRLLIGLTLMHHIGAVRRATTAKWRKPQVNHKEESETRIIGLGLWSKTRTKLVGPNQSSLWFDGQKTPCVVGHSLALRRLHDRPKDATRLRIDFARHDFPWPRTKPLHQDQWIREALPNLGRREADITVKLKIQKWVRHDVALSNGDVRWILRRRLSGK